MSSATGDVIHLHPSEAVSAAGSVISIERPATRRKSGSAARSAAAEKKIEGAVYAHLRAMRSLGRETITSREVADALAIPISDVNIAFRALRAKGVKVIG